ncbi:hypothetical protein [Xenorhabdus sp. IM139775]|uniref:hypothetical protein n=1 Tax=Xenorhabdus sp. IM139775 TaxID=3025876 RepID=UPI00235812A7|nr:hypothetical protein [Xenorhabdus sp. IM139775]MDC9592671.1 hypothetical protein [Xenorhabdus sp. IM139775]
MNSDSDSDGASKDPEIIELDFDVIDLKSKSESIIEFNDIPLMNSGIMLYSRSRQPGNKNMSLSYKRLREIIIGIFGEEENREEIVRQVIILIVERNKIGVQHGAGVAEFFKDRLEDRDKSYSSSTSSMMSTALSVVSSATIATATGGSAGLIAGLSMGSITPKEIVDGANTAYHKFGKPLISGASGAASAGRGMYFAYGWLNKVVNQMTLDRKIRVIKALEGDIASYKNSVASSNSDNPEEEKFIGIEFQNTNFTGEPKEYFFLVDPKIEDAIDKIVELYFEYCNSLDAT